MAIVFSQSSKVEQSIMKEFIPSGRIDALIENFDVSNLMLI